MFRIGTGEGEDTTKATLGSAGAARDEVKAWADANDAEGAFELITAEQFEMGVGFQEGLRLAVAAEPPRSASARSRSDHTPREAADGVKGPVIAMG